jgi:hypothetical protein
LSLRHFLRDGRPITITSAFCHRSTGNSGFSLTSFKSNWRFTVHTSGTSRFRGSNGLQRNELVYSRVGDFELIKILSFGGRKKRTYFRGPGEFKEESVRGDQRNFVKKRTWSTKVMSHKKCLFLNFSPFHKKPHFSSNAFKKTRRRPGFDLGDEPPSQYTSIRDRNALKGAISFASPPSSKSATVAKTAIDDDLDIIELSAPTPRPTDLALPRGRYESGDLRAGKNGKLLKLSILLKF